MLGNVFKTFSFLPIPSSHGTRNFACCASSPWFSKSVPPAELQGHPRELGGRFTESSPWKRGPNQVSLHTSPQGVRSQSLSTARRPALVPTGAASDALNLANSRNAKQSHSDMSLTLLGRLSSERQETTTAGEGCGERQPLHTLQRERKLVQPPWKILQSS